MFLDRIKIQFWNGHSSFPDSTKLLFTLKYGRKVAIVTRQENTSSWPTTHSINTFIRRIKYKYKQFTHFRPTYSNIYSKRKIQWLWWCMCSCDAGSFTHTHASKLRSRLHRYIRIYNQISTGPHCRNEHYFICSDVSKLLVFFQGTSFAVLKLSATVLFLFSYNFFFCYEKVKIVF